MAETPNISNFRDLKISKKNQKASLVLIHGWGLNAAVWQPFISSLPDSFTDVFNVVTFDLPGFGTKVDEILPSYSLANICQKIALEISQPAIYLGWSLGGLVATEMALSYPEKVLGLITVASSPHFIEEKRKTVNGDMEIWPGIKSQVLDLFHQQLQIDIKKTINGFLKVQALGSEHIRDDIKQISDLVFQYKVPHETTLAQSLRLLESSDHRKNLGDITQPFLRLYGAADSLVPKAAIDNVSQLAPRSNCYTFKQASHAPFISHIDDFKEILFSWLENQIKSDVIRLI
jgi:pimeloyl-[acyl-carrier protein] methyl ester esterase